MQAELDSVKLFVITSFSITFVCLKQWRIGKKKNNIFSHCVLNVYFNAFCRVIEYVDHLHEHFFDAVKIESGNYVLPEVQHNL